MRKLIAALIVVTIFLSGCSNSSTVQGVVNTPTKEVVQVSPTVQPTKTLVPTSTPIKIPTSTITPKPTVTVTPTEVVKQCGEKFKVPAVIRQNLGDLGVFTSYGIPHLPAINVQEGSRSIGLEGVKKISELKANDKISFVMESSGIISVANPSQKVIVNGVEWGYRSNSHYATSPKGEYLITKGSNVEVVINEDVSGPLMYLYYESGDMGIDETTKFEINGDIETPVCDTKTGLYYIDTSSSEKITIERIDGGPFFAFIPDEDISRVTYRAVGTVFFLKNKGQEPSRIWFLR